MATLFIDTSSNKEITVSLEIEGQKEEISQSVTRLKAQTVLPLVESLLSKQKITLEDVTAIEVNCGPGSFTGLRVGIAIANTFSKELGIPINGKKPGTILEAVYS